MLRPTALLLPLPHTCPPSGLPKTLNTGSISALAIAVPSSIGITSLFCQLATCALSAIAASALLANSIESFSMLGLCRYLLLNVSLQALHVLALEHGI